MESFFDIFVEFVTNNRLDEIAREDEVFSKYDVQLNELYPKIEEMKLKEEDKKVILELLETQVAQNARLTDIACKRAAVEIVNFLKMVGVLQDSVV